MDSSMRTVLIWTLPLTARSKLTLLAISELATDEGRCALSNAQLSALTGLDPRDLRRAYADLARRGFVRRVMTRGVRRYFEIDLRTSGASPSLGA